MVAHTIAPFCSGGNRRKELVNTQVVNDGGLHNKAGNEHQARLGGLPAYLMLGL